MTTNEGAGEEREDVWKELASLYLSLSKGPTIKPIENLLRLINNRYPLSKATSIMDIGCGPGPVINKLLEQFGAQIPSSATLRANDFSPAMVEQVKQMKEKNISEGNGTWKRVEIEIMDAQELTGIDDESVSHVTGGFVVFMLPDPQKALRATLRVLTSEGNGGVAAFSSWKGSEWMDMMAQVSVLRPGKVLWPFPESWRSTEGAKKELETAGFTDVEAEEVHTEMSFDDHEGVARFFIQKIPGMKQHTEDMTEEEVQKLQDLMIEHLKSLHPVAPGIMKGTAIVVAGRKPGKGRS